jgi:hypothetical protein
VPTFAQLTKQKAVARKRLTTLAQSEAALIQQASTTLAKFGYTIERVRPVVVIDEVEKALSPPPNGQATDSMSQELLSAVLEDMAKSDRWGRNILVGPRLLPKELVPKVARRAKALERKRNRAVDQFLGSYKPVLRKAAASVRKSLGKFICPRKGCDRRFGYPHHLARHIKAIHGKKKSAR